MTWQTHDVFNQFDELSDYNVFATDPALTEVVRAAGAAWAEPALESYHLFPTVRGDLLAKLGRKAEAAKEFRRAADMTRNERERTMLLERASAAAARPAE